MKKSRTKDWARLFCRQAVMNLSRFIDAFVDASGKSLDVFTALWNAIDEVATFTINFGFD